MKTILIIDTDAPFFYDDASISIKSTGGTVFAIVLLARALAQHANVLVVQCDSKINYDSILTSSANSPLLLYTSSTNLCKALDGRSPDLVIHVRSKHENLSLRDLKQKFPKAFLVHWQHITLWQHNLVERLTNSEKRRYINRMCGTIKDCFNLGATIVCTSKFHQTNIYAFTNLYRLRCPPVAVIYNPVDISLCASNYACEVDNNQLLYFSNPDRGLSRAIHVLRATRDVFKDIKLRVALPGYKKMRLKNIEGVEFIGALARPLLWNEVRKSLAVVYPNVDTPECFGYVFAESNALNTPVVSHNIGAASEVLTQPDMQLVDCRIPQMVIDKIVAWRSGSRPVVGARFEFSPSIIARNWLELLIKQGV